MYYVISFITIYINDILIGYVIFSYRSHLLRTYEISLSLSKVLGTFYSSRLVLSPPEHTLPWSCEPLVLKK